MDNLDLSTDKIQELTSKLIDIGVPFLLNLIAAIIIYVIGKWVAKIASSIVGKLMTKAKVDPALVGFTKTIVHTIIIVFALIASVGKLGVQTASFVALLGAAGLAIGMALQGTLSNFAAGVMIIIFKPYKIGDYIEAGGTEGIVEEIQIFNTILATLDNKQVILPNSMATGDKIINYSAKGTRRLDLIFGISYDDNIGTARDALMKVIKEDKRYLDSPEPFVGVDALADSSVNLACRPWVKVEDYWDMYFDLQEKGKIELEAAGITIPFPQRDVHNYTPNS